MKPIVLPSDPAQRIEVMQKVIRGETAEFTDNGIRYSIKPVDRQVVVQSITSSSDKQVGGGSSTQPGKQ